MRTYSKVPITVVGSVNVQVSYKGQTAQVVVKGDRPTLLGRNWLSKIQSKIHHTSSPGLSELLSTYDEVSRKA